MRSLPCGCTSFKRTPGHKRSRTCYRHTMTLRGFVGGAFFVFLLAACAEDSDGGITGTDASGDSSQIEMDGATDARESVPDSTLPMPDGMVTRPDADLPDANVPDAVIPDASLGDATVIIPDASVECTGPEDCSVPSDECNGAALTDYEATCVEGVCGVRIRKGTCADPSDTCQGLNHISYAAQCANNMSCGDPEETITPCDAPADICKGDTLLEYTATCSGAEGCGVSSQSSTCPANASECKGLNHISFTPSCNDNGTACLTGGNETVTACTAPVNRCAGGELTTNTPVCNASQGCSVNSDTAPCGKTPAPLCRRLTHVSYNWPCATRSTCAATYTESTENCTAPPTSCDDGVRTTHRATCDAAQGCGVTSESAPCNPEGMCDTSGATPVYISYAPPSCADASTCAKPEIEARKVCSARAPYCLGTTHITPKPTCDASAGCGVDNSNTEQCGKVESCSIKAGSSSCTVIYTIGGCDPQKGCVPGEQQTQTCKPNQCVCGEKPGCSAL